MDKLLTEKLEMKISPHSHQITTRQKWTTYAMVVARCIPNVHTTKYVLATFSWINITYFYA